MWNIEDKQGFEIESSNNRGQINLNQDLGKIIYELSSDSENKVFVDIGTWNGLGSTKCFIEAMKINKGSKLYTIENNTEKFESAKSRWHQVIQENQLDIEFINGTLIENHEIDKWLVDFDIYLDDNHKYWLSIDKTNSQNLVNLICESIDILLVDGSEFTGYLEVKLLKDVSKFILLDDVNTMKNEKSRELLLSDSNFELLREDLFSRNGYSVFKNKNK